MNKRQKQLLIDICMTLCLLLLMSAQRIGNLAHEVLGITFFILFIIHHYLNKQWIKSLGKGKYTPIRILQTGLNIILFIDILLMMLSGMTVSRVIFKDLSIPFDDNTARTIHLLGSYIGFIAMSIHIGLHFKPMKTRLENKFPIFKTKLATILYILLALLGLYNFINEDITSYLTLSTQYVFINYSEAIIVYLLKYFTILILFAGIGYYITKSKKITVRKIILSIVSILLIFVLCIYTLAMKEDMNTIHHNIHTNGQNNDTLIVYFSRAAVTKNRDNIDASAHASIEESGLGRNEELVNILQEVTGADTYELITKNYYPTNYELTCLKALIELQRDERPELLDLPDNIDQYKTIYIGYPAWWGQPPMCVATFLDAYDFTGKTIIPFQISIDTPASSSDELLKSWVKTGAVKDVYDANNESLEKFKEWVGE